MAFCAHVAVPAHGLEPERKQGRGDIMTIVKRIATNAAEVLAGSILISLNLRWIAQARRRLRKWRNAA